jgi:sigma-B regulation protein RsbU (phosphoserine phosphatase)
MFQSSNYDLEAAQLNPGDLVVLFTDGLADIRNEHQQFFGVEGVSAIVRDNRTLPLRELAGIVIDRALEFGADNDDITLCMMKVT